MQKLSTNAFYASLDYYQKGTDCRLRIGGSASIVEDHLETAIRLDRKNNSQDNIFLIKLRIISAEYFENKTAASTSLKDQVKSFFHNLFYERDYRQFDFSKTMQYK
ncbi:MAG: hypothetical protein WDM71_09535 [Ferruginibacter sp.]